MVNLTDTEKALIYELLHIQLESPQGLEPAFKALLEDLDYSLQLDGFKQCWITWREEIKHNAK